MAWVVKGGHVTSTLENTESHDLVSVATLANRASSVLERLRSEEHTSELQSLMRISYAVLCLKKKTIDTLDTEQQKNSNTTQRATKTRTKNIPTQYIKNL